MKTIKKLLVLSLFISAVSFSQNNSKIAMNTSSTNGIFEFETEIIDYGTIQQNSNGERVFKFKNVGNAPIIITKVNASCGCTVPTKPNQPIMPNETAEIGVKYATNRVGSFSKTLTITSNASEKTKTVRIKGVVLKAEKVGLVKPKTSVSVN
jgi:hypothetical protein